MAVMPGVAYRPINYDSVDRMARYDVVCLHTIVGHDPAPAAHFSVGAGGEITQNRDTVYQSAANYTGNYRVIAIETEDMGPEFGSWNVNDGHAVPAWTDAQCEAIARILVWCHRTHGVPLSMAPNSCPASRGVGYHRMGIDGNWAGYAYGGRVAGCEVWTRSPGKVCPGDRRIRQLIERVLPRAGALVAPGGGVRNVMHQEPLLGSDGGYISRTLPMAVGSNSGCYSRVWLSIAGDLEVRATVWFQGGPNPAQYVDQVIANDDRWYREIPSGTESVIIHAASTGSMGLMLEGQPK